MNIELWGLTIDAISSVCTIAAILLALYGLRIARLALRETRLQRHFDVVARVADSSKTLLAGCAALTNELTTRWPATEQDRPTRRTRVRSAELASLSDEQVESAVGAIVAAAQRTSPDPDRARGLAASAREALDRRGWLWERLAANPDRVPSYSRYDVYLELHKEGHYFSATTGVAASADCEDVTTVSVPDSLDAGDVIPDPGQPRAELEALGVHRLALQADIEAVYASAAANAPRSNPEVALVEARGRALVRSAKWLHAIGHVRSLEMGSEGLAPIQPSTPRLLLLEHLFDRVVARDEESWLEGDEVQVHWWKRQASSVRTFDADTRVPFTGRELSIVLTTGGAEYAIDIGPMSPHLGSTETPDGRRRRVLDPEDLTMYLDRVNNFLVRPGDLVNLPPVVAYGTVPAEGYFWMSASEAAYSKDLAEYLSTARQAVL